MANNIRVKVGGMEYSINSDDDELYVKSLAAELDRRLTVISQQSPFLSTTMTAVVAALEAYDNEKKQRLEMNALRRELKTALEDAAVARSEIEMLRRRLARYEGEYRHEQD